MPSLPRLRAAFIHLVISLLIAGMAALLVFGIWYAPPFDQLSGGRELFLLLISVDVVLGPLLTFAIYNPNKSRGKITFDLAVIGTVQLAALIYGLHTVAAARPVHLVFEYDRFRVVHAADINTSHLPQAPKTLQTLPIWGPSTIAVRPLTAADKTTDAIFASLSGDEIANRPEAWRPYDAQAQNRVLRAALPLPELLAQFPQADPAAKAISQRTGLGIAELRYLPLQSRHLTWTAIIHPKSADIIGYLDIDGFGKPIGEQIEPAPQTPAK